MFERPCDEDEFDPVEDLLIYDCVHQIIPKIPEDLYNKLKLWSTGLGGLFRDKLPEPYIEEHHEAFRICRERANRIQNMINFLQDLHQQNQEMIGCLRNTYKPPYDPETFLDAYFYDHKDNPQCVDQKWVQKPENLNTIKTAYDTWVNNFKIVTNGTGAVLRGIGQYQDRSKGFMIFYVPGFIGEFHYTVPENINTDFGHRDERNDMKMSISYSIPGRGVITWDCMSYFSICESYTFEDLNKKFLEVIKNNDKEKTLKTETDFVDELKQQFERKIQQFKTDPKSVREGMEKEFLEKLKKEMDEKNITVTETDGFKRELKYMLVKIHEATDGVKRTREDN